MKKGGLGGIECQEIKKRSALFKDQWKWRTITARSSAVKRHECVRLL